MWSVWGVEWTVISLMIAANAVFAAYEIALASVSVARLQVLVRENRAGARTALWMKENMEASLAVVQLGITFVGAIAAATGGAGAVESIAPMLEQIGFSPTWAEAGAITTIVIPLSFVTILLGELFPKVFALRNKEWVCLRLSPVMRWFSFAVWPVVWLLESSVLGLMTWGERRWQAKLDKHAKPESAELQELRAIAALARTSRLIGGREENIIVQAARLASRPVREIMLPAEHIAMIALESSLSDSLVIAHLDMHTRFPVCQRAGDPQSIIGYVNFKDIVVQLRLSPTAPSLSAVVRAIFSVQQDLHIAACLERMIHEHTHIALVRDSNQRVLGMITLEDVLEELVGEIHDEFDRLPTHVVASGRAWVVGGGIALSKLHEQTGINLEQEAANGVHTVNDWVAKQLGRKVQGGDVIQRNGLRVVVRKLRRQQVLEAQIATDSQPERT